MNKILTYHSLKVFLLTFILLGLLALSASSQKTSRYFKYPDTLILNTHPEKGAGLFHQGARILEYRDTTELKIWNSELKKWDYSPGSGISYPIFLDSLKVDVISIYFRPLRFYNAETKQVDNQSNLGKHDKLIFNVQGYLNGKEVYIIDQNHNQDLTDDPIRQFHPIDWRGTEQLIRCEYDVKVGGERMKREGWVNIGMMDTYLLESTSQHVVAEFSINNRFFKIGVKDENSSSFCFVKPQLALLTEKGICKDTLTMREFAQKGEYVFLDDQPYCFHDFYSGCGTIILVKEHEYDKQVGIQMGLLAPDFKIKTVTGKIINKSELNDKPIMIVNLTGCGGPDTFEKYNKFFEKFKDEFHIISLEPKIDKKLPGLLVDTEDEFNKDFYKKYRNAYSSYDCFHIGLDGRIKDFFGITIWERSMLK